MRPPALISSFFAFLGAQLLVIGVADPARADLSGALESVEKDVCALYDQTKDAVVKVHAQQRQLQVGNISMPSVHRVGSGFFIDGDGRVLTAATVVRDAEICWIDWRGKRVPARILGRCERTNLAVLQLNEKTPFLPAGDSDALRVGSMVVAIGFPYDMASAPVLGAVNGLEIQRGTNVFVTSHIRASCRLSPGQSGSPLFNANGEVVGIAVAAHQDDQCFAMPINAARRVYEDIIKFGAPQYGWVGLDVTEKRHTWPETRMVEVAVVVQQVFSNTPAAAAGFMPGDKVTKVQTRNVRSLADILDSVFFYRSGDAVMFSVRRADQDIDLSLVTGTRPREDQPMLTRQPMALFPVSE